MLGLILSWREIGLGLHADVIAAINPLLLVEGGRRLYIAIFFFDSSISFPKLSAIFFYARIFPKHNKLFRINLWIVGSLGVGWIVSALLSTVFQCTPIERAWNPALPGHCINDFAWYTSTAAISLAIDFYILLLPVPMIWGLSASLRRRIYLLGAFFLAYSVIVLSLGRMISTIRLIPTVREDLTWSFPIYLYWACLEGSVSLVSVCVPNIIGLVKAYAHPARSHTGGTGSGRYKDSRYAISSSASAGVPSHPVPNADRDGFERLISIERSGAWDTAVNGQRHERSRDGSGTTIPLERIHVETEISVVDGVDDHLRTQPHAV